MNLDSFSPQNLSILGRSAREYDLMKPKTYTVCVVAEFPTKVPKDENDPIPDPWGALLQLGFEDSLASPDLTFHEKLPEGCFIRKLTGISAAEVCKQVTTELEGLFSSMFDHAGIRLFVMVAGDGSTSSFRTCRY
jgi:hypothetical protein